MEIETYGEGGEKITPPISNEQKRRRQIDSLYPISDQQVT